MDLQWPTDAIWDSYHVFNETFKSTPSADIHASVLVPKHLKPGRHPLLYTIHGGFLITGHGLFAPFFQKWADKLALDHGAIMVSTNHRLLPSVNGVIDVLEDLEDGWRWTKEHLVAVLEKNAPGHDVDFGRVLLTGSSSGGLCALHLGFSFPDDFRCIALAYPLVDIEDKTFVQGPDRDEPTVLRFPAEQIPSKEATLNWIEDMKRKPAVEAELERLPFAVAACQHGIFWSHALGGTDEDKRRYNPIARLRDGAQLPPYIWMAQGDDDSTTHVRSARAFVDRLRATTPGATLRYDEIPGGDHAFDLVEKLWEPMGPEAMAFVTSGWLSAAQESR